MHSPILAPTLALAAWTMVMWIWMYATRLPAILRAKMTLDPQAPRGAQMSSLPAEVRWKADNFNNLLELPTVFYAVTLTLALLGAGDGAALAMAWAFVGLRVVHSLVQATVNHVMVRFTLFFVSSLVLIGLIVRAGMVLLR